MVTIVNDEYRNAWVGKLVYVADRSWGDNRRLVKLLCEDRIIVRRFVHNWADAEVLIDRKVCVYDDTLYAFD